MESSRLGSALVVAGGGVVIAAVVIVVVLARSRATPTVRDASERLPAPNTESASSPAERTGPPAEPVAPSAPVVTRDDAPAATPDARTAPAPAPAPDERAPLRDAARGPAVHVDLSTAEATVATQIALLAAGHDEAFRETFLPRARPQVTEVALARCRTRLFGQGVPVRPDWEMAEQDTEDGHPVRRVSMFGHELTGFHDVGGRWLADRVWCVPTAVP